MDRDLCVLGPVSSLLFWRAERCGLIGLSLQDEEQPDLVRCHARIRDVRKLNLVRMLGDTPLDVIVGDRTKSHGGTLHTIVLSGKMPPGSFMRVRQGLYVCTPELCFTLLGRGRQVIRLAELGLELCGTYSLMPDQSGRFCSCTALTDRKRLSAFSSLMDHRHGLTAARKALGFVVDGSGSPQESSLFLVLTAPERMGGYGLSRPELNAKVSLHQRATTSTAPETCVVSQLYRDDKGKKILAVDLCGSGSIPKLPCCEDLARDGLDVVIISQADITSMGKLDAKALRIARLLGRPARVATGVQRQRRRDLFELLLDESFWHMEHETLCQLAGYHRSVSRGRRVA